MRDAGPGDPMRAAQVNMRPPPVKRFYKRRRRARGGRPLRADARRAWRAHAGKNRLAARSRAVMEKAADEWARQGETLDPSDMPVTRLVNSALDGVAKAMDETRAEIVRYAGSDFLCYRAEEPEALAERQRAAFDPVLDWAAERSERASRSPPGSCMSTSRPNSRRLRRRNRGVRRSGRARRAERGRPR